MGDWRQFVSEQKYLGKVPALYLSSDDQADERITLVEQRAGTAELITSVPIQFKHVVKMSSPLTPQLLFPPHCWEALTLQLHPGC